MVFFSCDSCGEMLKKSQVDGHVPRCRQGCDSVSCVDCSVSFFGDDYRAHTSCITEAERYEGKLAKKSTKRNPQQEWMDVVTNCIELAPPNLKGYLQTMSQLDNIPRKERQFRNFTANSLNLRGKNGDAIVGEIWNVLKAEREKRHQEKENQQAKQKQTPKKEDPPGNDNSKNESSTPADKVKGSPNDSRVSQNESAPKLDRNVVEKAMTRTLKKAPNRSMKLKDLRKILGEKLGLPKSVKKNLKQMLQDAPNTTLKSKVKLDGKIIALV